MRDSCTDTDCFCGHCDDSKVTYNIWKDLTKESDQYGQKPNCEICDKVWDECNPFEGPHPANIHDFTLPYTIECLQSMKESIGKWLTEMESENDEKNDG